MNFQNTEVFTNDDLTMLRDVLHRYCLERSIAAESEEAKKVAADLIDWFAFGIRTPDDFWTMIDPAWRTSQAGRA